MFNNKLKMKRLEEMDRRFDVILKKLEEADDQERILDLIKEIESLSKPGDNKAMVKWEKKMAAIFSEIEMKIMQEI